MKSSVPWRTSPISRSMFGWTPAPMSPPIRMWTPMTASSSDCVQPARFDVWPNTSDSTISPMISEPIDWNTWIARLPRYWSSLSAPTRKKTPNSLSGRSGSRRDAATATGAAGPTARATSATHRGVAPHGERPDQTDRDHPDHDPQRLHREAAEERRHRQSPDQRLDRKPERPLERQH